MENLPVKKIAKKDPIISISQSLIKISQNKSAKLDKEDKFLSAGLENAIKKAALTQKTVQNWCNAIGEQKLLTFLKQIRNVNAANFIYLMDHDNFSKDIRKQARKILFEFRTHGISPEIKVINNAEIVKYLPDEAQITATAAEGFYFIRWVVHKPRLFSKILYACIDENEGVIDGFEPKEEMYLSSKEHSQFYTEIYTRLKPTNVPVEYAKYRIAKGVALRRKQGESLPGRIPYWTSTLPLIEQELPHPIWSIYNRKELPRESQSEQFWNDILELLYNFQWHFEAVMLEPVAYKIGELYSEGSEVPNEERLKISELYISEATEELFTPDIVKNYVRRLEDFTYCLHHDEDTISFARPLLASAVALQKNPKKSKFANILMHVSLSRLIAMLNENKI